MDEAAEFGSRLHDKRQVVFEIVQPAKVPLRGQQLCHAAQLADRCVNRHRTHTSLALGEEALHAIIGDVESGIGIDIDFNFF